MCTHDLSTCFISPAEIDFITINQNCQLFINPQIEKRVIYIFPLSILVNVNNSISGKNLFIL